MKREPQNLCACDSGPRKWTEDHGTLFWFMNVPKECSRSRKEISFQHVKLELVKPEGWQYYYPKHLQKVNFANY